MTRGTFYLVLTDGSIWESPEFNGDMYIENGYGVDAIKLAENVRQLYQNQQSSTIELPEYYKQEIIKFNENHHKYDDIEDEDWLLELVETNLNKVIADQCSDYSYVLDMQQNKVRVFCFSHEITDDNEVQDVLKSLVFDKPLAEKIEAKVKPEDAQNFLFDTLANLNRKLHIHGIYRHFKGKYYLVEDIATDSETQKPMVVYRHLYGDKSLCVRPLDMFMSLVDHEKYPDVKQKYRFEEVDEIS